MLYFKTLNVEAEFLSQKPLGKSISFHAGETIKAEVLDILPNGGVVIRTKGGKLTIKTEIPLNKDTSLLLKILPPTVDNKIRLQLIGVIENKAQSKMNISEINNLLKEIIKNNVDIKVFDEIVKFFLSSSFSISGNQKAQLQYILQMMLAMREKGIVQRLYSINNKLKTNNNSPLSKIIQSMLMNISQISSENLRQAVENSGIFFEAKLKHNKSINGDLKGELLKIKSKLEGKKEFAKVVDEINILLKDIETHQMLSKLTGALITFLPIIWEGLKESQISIKKGKSKYAKQYFCRISLDFEKFGKVLAFIVMFENEFFISFKLEDEHLEKIMKLGIDNLKNQLKKKGINTVVINFFHKEITFEQLENFESLESLINLRT